MIYLGDFLPGATVHFKWNTTGSSGASITRATNGTIYVYKDDATASEVTTGVTDTEDHDSNTGVHHCKIALTDSFYAPGSEYSVVLKAATIDGQTVNAVLAHFSIARMHAQYGLYAGACTSAGTTTTVIDSGLTEAATDFWKGRVLIFTSGNNKGQATKITGFTPASDQLTVDTLSNASASGDKFIIV